jgi:hypothetical protein
VSDPTQPHPARASGAAAVAVLVLGVLLVLGSAGAGVYFLSEWAGDLRGPDGSGTTTTTTAGGEPAAQPVAPLISQAGFDQLLDALKEKTGSTTVVGLTVYPRYAVAVVPLPGGKGRTMSLYYDGTIRETSLGTSDEALLDLRKVDPEVLVKLSRQARKAVEDPNQYYLILHAPDVQRAAIYAYASNAYGEGGYVAADLRGKVVNKVGW